MGTYSIAVILVAKIGLGVALCVALGVAICGPPPRCASAVRDLRRLLVSSLALDSAGIAAALGHHISLAVGTSAIGVMVAAVAGWLSRGAAGGDDGPTPGTNDSSPDPGSDDGWDWDRLDRERRGWERPREPVSR